MTTLPKSLPGENMAKDRKPGRRKITKNKINLLYKYYVFFKNSK